MWRNYGMQWWSKSFACSPFTNCYSSTTGKLSKPYNQMISDPRWIKFDENPHVSRFIWVKILLLKMVASWNPFLFYFKSTSFTSSTFPNQPDFSQNQLAVITLNIGSPHTLLPLPSLLLEGPPMFFLVVPGKFLGILGQDPSDSKSNRLHVDIISQLCCFHSFGAYSIDSSKVSNVNQLFLKLN